MVITSVNNPKIKEIKKLKNSKYSKEQKLFLIEGEHLVKEAFKLNLLKLTISLDDVSYNVPNLIVNKSILESLSSINSTPNIIGVCKYIDENKPLGNRILILDNIQDPGNLGTIIRSSVAFNFTSVVLSLDTVSKYNNKVIRSTQGMLFNTNVISCDIKSLIKKLKDEDYMIYATDVVGGVNVKDIKKPSKFAIVMGNEGSGVSSDIKDLADCNLYIKMNKDCESLNVAVASSILMYEMQD